MGALINVHTYTPKSQAVDLIIKPLEACNYQCTYCSSTNIAPDDDRHAKLQLEPIFRFFDAYPNTTTVIVNGGEPLLMSPTYYGVILDEIKRRGMKTTLSFTSNLEVFFANPDPWLPLFADDRVGVCTSFEYGSRRLDKKGRVLDEERFLQIWTKFQELVGYRLDFISVITWSNSLQALDNVRLAQSLDVDCKLNYAVESGDHATTFALPEMYATYLDVYLQGLHTWEFSTRQMLKSLTGNATACPLLIDCDSKIRAMNPGGDYYSCGALADDKSYAIDFDEDLLSSKPLTPLRDDRALLSMKEDCFACELFAICNGCKKTVRDTKKQGKVESHCAGMKRLETSLLQAARGGR